MQINKLINKLKINSSSCEVKRNEATLTIWRIIAPYIQSKLQTFKDMNMHYQSHKLVHTSSIHGHVHASFSSGCAFVYFTV